MSAVGMALPMRAAISISLVASAGAPRAAQGAAGRQECRPSLELARPRTAQSFCVPKADLAAQGYDLSLNRYKEVVHETIEHRAPREILADLTKLEEEIQQGMKELEGMLG